MAAGEFIHLRTHSEYSMVDGLAKVGELAEGAAGLGMAALGLTDHSNLFGLIKFYRACLAAGVKPILGADLQHRPEGMEDEVRLTVLACSAAGYGNLLRLVSCAYTNPNNHGRVTVRQVIDHGEGLILLSGPKDTEIGQALLREDRKSASQAAQRLAQQFPDRFYLEVQRTGRQEEDACLRGCVALAESLNLPVVATNEVCFLSAQDHEAHETRVCINEGRTVNDPKRPRRHCAQQYLKSAEAMAELFKDLPEAVRNTLEIMQRCTVRLNLGDFRLPDYPVPQRETLEGYLERMARDGLDRRLAALKALGAYPVDEATYRQRLAYELGVINETGFPGYFLIVMEFIAWAKAQNIPVGPGRGSGAGSLAAYALGITNLDPVHYDLLFERFLNPERVSMPDFDVDFCVEGRDQVIAHVCERYGVEAVSQIATFGSMAAKAVVRDVARAQGKPFALGDKLSKLIPNRLGTTLASALAEVSELKAFLDEDEEAAEIMDMARKLEGVVRNIGRHAGGVVIAPSKLTDFVPLYVDARSGGLISQYDKDDVERAGLVKFDFLGLTTLTIISWAAQAANKFVAAQGKGAEPIDMDQLPLDDHATFELLKRTETAGVFQLESRGMKDLIRGLQPDSIDDIIALVALYRPGPMENNAHQEYVERKHGRKKVSYPHPKLQPVLQSTFGVVIYQEQVMQIARILAGFSLGQADILRKAMGKKNPEEMARVRGQFLAGAKAGGVDGKLANDIFDQMATFAGYAFNKSHSATYALVAYQTAWLKAHYPAEFMAATLSADMENTDKVVSSIAEARRMKLGLAPPSVNSSEYRFSGRGRQIVYGLGAVRGVGRGPVESIIEARREGAFKSLAEFCLRVNVKRANKRVLEALIHAGAMDDFAAEGERTGNLRARLLGELDPALLAASQASRDAELGMGDLFGGVKKAAESPAEVRPLTYAERLELEKQTLGLYLTGHPIEPYLPEFRGKCRRLADLRVGDGIQRAGGLVVDCRTIRRGRGRNMEILVLDDSTVRLEAVLYPEVERDRHKLEKGRILVLEGKVEADDYNGGHRMRVERTLSIDEWRQQAHAHLSIDLASGKVPTDLPKRLTATLASYRVGEGGCQITIKYRTAAVAGVIALGWRVKASEALMAQLKAEFGDDQVAVDFGDAA